MIHMRAFTKFEENNLKFLTQKSVEFTLVQITKCGCNKCILDATDPIRQYFSDSGLHDYSTQLNGVEYKIYQPSLILDETSAYPTKTSLYRARERGDTRFWPGMKIKEYCEYDDIFMILFFKGKLYYVDITRINIEKVCNSSIITPLKDLIAMVHSDAMSVSDELAEMFREMAQEWHRVETTGDTAVGRTIESLLGIEMNSSTAPDYKGIELKSFREDRPGVRKTLFTQAPDWENSALHSGKEIVNKYGYMRNGQLTYRNTLNCLKPNSQNLGLTLYTSNEILAIEEKKDRTRVVGKDIVVTYSKVADVALWQLSQLHERLLTKHHETFWIEVESKIINGVEMFKPTKIEHTKRPIVSQFDTLLDTGYITVDLLLGRPKHRGDTYSFKLKKTAAPMLFPESSLIQLL